MLTFCMCGRPLSQGGEQHYVVDMEKLLLVGDMLYLLILASQLAFVSSLKLSYISGVGGWGWGRYW